MAIREGLAYTLSPALMVTRAVDDNDAPVPIA